MVVMNENVHAGRARIKIRDRVPDMNGIAEEQRAAVITVAVIAAISAVPMAVIAAMMIAAPAMIASSVVTCVALRMRRHWDEDQQARKGNDATMKQAARHQAAPSRAGSQRDDHPVRATTRHRGAPRMRTQA